MKKAYGKVVQKIKERVEEIELMKEAEVVPRPEKGDAASFIERMKRRVKDEGRKRRKKQTGRYSEESEDESEKEDQDEDQNECQSDYQSQYQKEGKNTSSDEKESEEEGCRAAKKLGRKEHAECRTAANCGCVKPAQPAGQPVRRVTKK